MMQKEPLIRISKMHPEEVHDGGKTLTIRYSYQTSPWGELLLAATAHGLCYLAFITTGREEVLEELKQRFPNALYLPEYDAYQQQAFSMALGQESTMTEALPLHLTGTDFQISVWSELLNIPIGATTSYGILAERLNRPKACRAVGTAVGNNPVSILIPCHRVLRASGALGGYHWGLDRKIALLAWEEKYKHHSHTQEI